MSIAVVSPSGGCSSGGGEAIALQLKNYLSTHVVVEHPVLEMMEHAQHRRSIRVINGLTQGNLTRALYGEDVETLIYAD